jgi:tetratricopeptide (TPR) repeat protein
VATLQKGVHSEPKSARGFYLLGIAQKSLGLSDLAKVSFAHALEIDPQAAQASVALASLNIKEGDLNEAQRLANNALKTNPSLLSARLASAQATLAKGDVRQGEAELQEALRRDPASLSALATLMSLSIRQGRAQEAVQRISELLHQYPQNAGLHFLLAVGYFSLKDLEKSEASVKQAIALDARISDAYTLLANINFAKGEVEKAKTDLRRAIAANPRNVTNYVVLATQYEKEGNWEEAKRLFEEAHEIDSTAPMVAAELAFLYLEHGGDVNVAVTLARMAKLRMPHSPVTADALGWAYYKLGASDSAISELKESTQNAPRNSMYQYHLGMAYMAAHRVGLARGCLLTALKNDPNFLDAASARAALDKLLSGRP